MVARVVGGRKPLSEESEIIGESAAFVACLERTDAVAKTDATVMISGESGVGKELVARRVHAMSRRHKRPLITVNCAAIPRDLFESEFFGHAKGAFTGATANRAGRLEAANTGTLFLDEVGEIPVELQGKLLRALQQMSYERVGEDRTREVNVRIIAATNRSLMEDVVSGRFRRDLFYRLSVFPIEVPPLRARRDDIVGLAEHFIEAFARRDRTKVPRLTRPQCKQLESYDWPGNIRELKNVIERAVILAKADGTLDLICAFGVRANFISSRDIESDGDNERRGYLTASEFEDFERQNLIAVMEASGWRVAGECGAAELLGLKISTLSSKLKAMNIRRPARDSLYLRVGGQARVAAFSRDLLGRVQADPVIGRFWRTRSNLGIQREEKFLVQYLCAAFGGPHAYQGLDMVAAHADLGISVDDWAVFEHHLGASFEALGIGVSEQKAIGAMVDSLAGDIVTL